MKKLILITLLLSIFTLHAGECTKSTTVAEFDSPIAYMQDDFVNEDIGMDEILEHELDDRYQITEEYFKQLNQFLRNSNDVSIQLSAIDGMFSPVKIDTSKKILKQAINENSGKHSLFLAASACNSNEKLIEWCHKLKVHKIHQQVDPENVFSYLLALHDDADVENNKLLQLAVDNSQHANSFYYENTLKIAALMDEFNQLNSDSYQEYMAFDDVGFDEFNQEIKSLQLVEKGLIDKNIDLKSQDFSSIISAIGISMAKVVAFKPITDNCKRIENADICIQVGRLLSNGNTMIDKMIGSSLIKQSYELLDYDISEISQISDNSKKEMEKLVCYNSSTDVMYTQMLNKDLMMQFINDAKQFGEFKAFEKMAFRVYETIKQHGFNPDFNPYDC